MCCASTAFADDLETLLWLHDAALINRDCYRKDPYAWMREDDVCSAITARIAEHVIREEVDVGLVQGGRSAPLTPES